MIVNDDILPQSIVNVKKILKKILFEVKFFEIPLDNYRLRVYNGIKNDNER